MSLNPDRSIFDATLSAAADPTPLRVAIVTAYFREDRRILKRCLRSVRGQTATADHIFVADGIPQDWLDREAVRHIKLDRSHGDYGGTPRGVGSLLAIAEGYDAVGFLDADNWLETDHVQKGILASRDASGRYDYVIARRNMMRPDETILPVRDEPVDQHVDTNCFLFFPGSFHALQMFALIPKQLSSIGDRIFYAFLRRQNLRSNLMDVPSVNYECLWASLYKAVGETPPPEAKANIDQTPIAAWLATLSLDEKMFVARRTGNVISPF